MSLEFDENMVWKVQICYCTKYICKNAGKWKLSEYICNLIIRDIVNLVRIHQFYEGQIAL